MDGAQMAVDDDPSATVLVGGKPVPRNLVWNFSQVFGDKAGEGEIAEADIISAVTFSHDGEYLATGDKGGRVVLFERNQDPDVRFIPSQERKKKRGRKMMPLLPFLLLLFTTFMIRQGNDAEYRFYTEFQSHEPEFDYLKSLEIEEKINQIKWLKRRNVRKRKKRRRRRRKKEERKKKRRKE